MKRLNSIFMLILLCSSFFTGLVNLLPAASGAGELFPSFIQIGENGYLSPASPTIRLTVTDSAGNFVPGILITVVNPAYCASYYYGWTTIQEVSNYVVTAQWFPGFALRDDFQFTFQKTGYNTKTVTRELAATAALHEFLDENGVFRSDSNLQYDIRAFPSKVMIDSGLETVFVDSTKYYVTSAYQSEFSWEDGSSYIVLDSNYVLVGDEQTCNKAIRTCLLGPKFAQCFLAEDLSRLSQLATDLKNAALGAYISWQIRDFAAQLLGIVIAKAPYFSVLNGAISNKDTLIQKIIANTNLLKDLWLQSLTEGPMPYLEDAQSVSELNLFSKALTKLDGASSMFAALRDTINEYHGTTRFEYSSVISMYEQWVRASHTLLTAADFISGMLPEADIKTQLCDVALEVVEGATGIPLSLLLSEENTISIFTNSEAKFAAMHEEFYEWIRQSESHSTNLRQRMQTTGYSRLVIPVPGKNDFSVSAYYVSTQTTYATIFAGNSITFTVDVRLLSGLASTVSLSVSGHDATMSAAFSPPSQSPPFTSYLVITSSSSTSGRFTLVVLGTSGSLTRSSIVVLEVLNPPNLAGAITVDPLNSGSGTIMYGAYTRYHGRVDPYYNGRTVALVQSVDGGSLYYMIGQYIPTSNNEWYYPTSLTVLPIWLSAWKGVEHPCTYLMKAFIEGTGEAVQSNIVSFTMIKATASTRISASAYSLVEGESLAITGTVFSELGIAGTPYICKGDWYIEWRQTGTTAWSSLASGPVSAEYKIPPDGGPYCILFNIPSQSWTAPYAGNFEFRVRYSGDKNYQGSSSEITPVTVQANTYPLTVSVIGLPATNTTNVYIDGLIAGTFLGEGTQTYQVDRRSIHDVSVNHSVAFGMATRYVSSKLRELVSGPGQISFTYNREHRLETEASPNEGGEVELTGGFWFAENSIVEAHAVSNSSFTFDHWTLDNVDFGKDPNITIVMGAAHSLKAFFSAQWFADGFESGNFDAWNGIVTSSGETAEVVASTYHHGRYSSRFTSNGNGGYEYAYCKKTLTPSTDIYARAYFLVTASGLVNNDNRFYFMILRAGSTNVAFVGWRKTAGVTRWNIIVRDGTGWPTAYSSSSPLTNQWYCVEFYWKKGVTDGLGSLWIDGNLVCSITGKNTGAFGNADSIRCGLAELYSCGSTVAYCDCVKVAGAYIGLEPVLPVYVHFESRQDSGVTSNLGTISLDSSSFALPNDVSKPLGAYAVTYNPEPAYLFDHWVTTGSITVQNSSSQSTTLAIVGEGTLQAIYKTTDLYQLSAKAIGANGLLIDRALLTSTSQGQTILASLGQTISLTIGYQIWQGPNPSEIDQLLFICSWTPNWPPPDGYYIGIYDGIPPSFPGSSGTTQISITVPNAGGTYYMWLGFCAHYSIPEAAQTFTTPLSLPSHVKIVVSPVVFKDDFESGSFAAWTNTSRTSGETSTVVNTMTHHGAYGAMFSSNGNGGYERAYSYKAISSSSELYARGYFNVLASGITDENDRGYFLIFRSGSNAVAFAGWRRTGGVTKWNLIIRDGTGWPTAFSTTSPSLNQWYCVELHWKKDATNGVGELWVDGVLVCTVAGKNTAYYGDINRVDLGLGELVNCGQTQLCTDCCMISSAYIGPESLPPPPPSSIFEDGFELGSFSSWTGTSITTGETAIVVNTVAHHGTYSALYTSNGNGGYERAYSYESIPSSTELYARGYFRIAQSGIAEDSDRFYLIVMKAGSTPVAFAGWRKTAGVVKWNLLIRDGSNWVNVYSTTSPSLDQWYCVELHWKKDAANGSADLWIDGSLVCSVSGKNTSGYGDVTRIECGLPEIVNCATCVVYCDCLLIRKNYVGSES